MRYSLLALISTLAFLSATAAAQAGEAVPGVFHQGPATAAVPVLVVEEQPLAPPEGIEEAVAEVNAPQPVFVREVAAAVPPLQQIQAMAAGQKEAQARRAKVLKVALKAKAQETQKPATDFSRADAALLASLAGTAPAAGGPEFAAATVAVKKTAPQPAPESPKLSHVNAFVDQIMSYHAAEEAKAGKKIEKAEVKVNAALAAPVPVAPPVTLETLLNSAGLALNSFIPPESTAGGVVAQWASGKISGLYERVAAHGDFSSQVSTYIGRYAQDCSTPLQVSISPVAAAKAGAMVTADMACNMPAKGYAAAFVFLEDGNGFSVIQHATLPAGKGKVQGIRDAIAQKLAGSSGFAAPQAIALSVVPPPLKLNIPAVAPAPVGERAMDGLATIIIQ